MVKCFIKDFYKILKARVVIFGMQVDSDVLYRGIANRPSHAYSSLYLSGFLLSILCIMTFLSKMSVRVS